MKGSYEGANAGITVKDKRFDMHCPLMGGTIRQMNFHKSKCKERMANKVNKATCYEVCYVDRGKNFKHSEEKTKTPPQEKVAIAAKLHEEGHLTSGIAVIMNCSQNMVRSYKREARRLGRLVSPKKSDKVKVALVIIRAMARMHAEGCKTSKIAEIHKCTNNTVSKKIRDAKACGIFAEECHKIEEAKS